MPKYTPTHARNNSSGLLFGTWAFSISGRPRSVYGRRGAEGAQEGARQGFFWFLWFSFYCRIVALSTLTTNPGYGRYGEVSKKVLGVSWEEVGAEGKSGATQILLLLV